MPVLIIAVFAASAAVCYGVARRRGGRARFWLTMGLLFGPLALPFVFFARGRAAPPR